MLIGDLIARFGDEEAATEALIEVGDLSLLAALRKCADEAGLAVGTFAALAIRRYAEDAPDEEWITLMGVLGRSADPGRAFITRALTRATQIAN